MMRKLILAALAIAGLSVQAVGAVHAIDYSSSVNRNSALPRLQSVRSGVAEDQPTEATLRTIRLTAGEKPTIPEEIAVGDVLELDLFADVHYSLTVVERVSGKSSGRISFMASTDGSEGPCNAVVVWTSEALQIDVRDAVNGRVYSVSTSPAGVVVQEIDPERESGKRLPPLLSRSETEIAEADANDRDQHSLSTIASSRDTFVDILVAYDTQAAAWAVANGGGIENFAETAVQKMNTAIYNSGISSRAFRFRLVGTHEVGTSAGGDIEGALKAAQSGSKSWKGGDWSGIRLKREKVGADIVVTLIDAGSTGVVGQGYALTSKSGSFAGLAYNCCSIRSVAIGHTMTHEVGHNMGAGHSDTQADDPGPQYHAYSSGYYFTANDTPYRTIMAYDSDGRTTTYHREVPYFSTPDELYYGVAVGDAAHNNALTIYNTYNMVARFKTAPDDEEESGTGDPESSESAGEFFGLNWTTSSEHPWTYGRLAGGSYAARSADFRNGSAEPSTGESWLETSIVGPKALSFSYDTYFYSGPFLVLVDGVVVRSIVGGEQWDSIDIPEGEHTVRFVFECYDWYCGNDTFNGVWLYDLRVCERSLVPVIVPDSTSDPETATRFTGELTVRITNSVPGSTIYYSTNHYGDAMSDAMVYAGPFKIDRSSVVRAFARAKDGTVSGLEEHIFIERHTVAPGEWTADAEGMLASASKSGKLILTVATFSKNGQTDSFGDLVGVAESEPFCRWARERGVYLLACDKTQSQGGWHYGEGARIDIGWGRYIEYLSASRYFVSLASNTDLTTTRLVVSRAWEPSKCVAEMAGQSGSYLGGLQYKGTVASLISCLENILSPRPSKTVTVTLDAKDGTVSPQKLTRTSGAAYGTLPTPVRKNYTFMGWTRKRTSYGEDGYSYDYYFGGGVVLSTDIVPYGDVTLEAQWEYTGVSVIFLSQSRPQGSYYWFDSNAYQRGSAYGTLPTTTPSMTGYTFLGWFSDKEWGEKITPTSIVPDQTTPITNYAHWVENEYAVRFNANGTESYPAKGEMLNQTFLYDHDDMLNWNQFTRTGYDFQGWTTHADWSYVHYRDGQSVSNLTSKADAVVDLYAVWKARQVKITFDVCDLPNAEGCVKACTVGEQFGWYNMPSYYSTRYVIDGFFTDRRGGVLMDTGTLVPAVDTTYYLHWHKKPYTVTFNANGGSGSMQPQAFFYGEPQRLNANAFVKSGHLFSGWATSPDGEVEFADRKLVNDLVSTEGGVYPLYAKWEPVAELGTTPVANGGPYRQTVGKYTWTFYVRDGKAYIYSLNDDNYYQCAVSPNPTGSVTVPAELGGRRVVSLVCAAFWYCRDVESIMVPSSVETLGSQSFYGCRSLTNVVLSSGVKTIGWSALGYTGLQGLDIPASVTEIGSYAFCGCSSLTNVIFRGNAPAVPESGDIFSSSTNVLVWVQTKSSGWGVPIPGVWQDRPIDYWSESYRIKFVGSAGTGNMTDAVQMRNRVVKLPPCTFSPPAGKHFAGWRCSNGRRYDDGCLVFNLAEPGETVTMTAIWE